MSCEPVSLTPPILWRWSEDYLSLDKTQPFLRTALKVISYATIIFPLVAIIIRSFYRAKYQEGMQYCNLTFNTWITQFKSDFAKKIKPSSLEEIWQQKEKIEDPEQKLESALKSLKTYAENQKTVIAIAHKALLDIAKNNTIDFARTVYKKIADFLRHHTNKDTLKTYEYHLNFLGDPDSEFECPSELYHPSTYLSNQCDKTLHAALIFILKHLRKQIKLHDKWDKVVIQAENKINDSQLKQALKYLGLTWLHGTKAFALDSARKYTQGTIAPAGELRKRNIDLLTGELGIEAAACGIHQRTISGTGLSEAATSINYAHYNTFESDLEERKYNSLLSLQLKTANDVLISNRSLNSQVESARRMKRLQPEKFAQDIPVIREKIGYIYSKIETEIFNKKDQKIFNSNDDYYTSRLYDILASLEELQTILEMKASAPIDAQAQELSKIPVVLGSTTIYGVPSLSEEIYPGSLQIGRDVQVIFTKKEHIEEVSKLVGSDVAVEEMGVLEAATKLDVALGKYLYDVYSLKKWQKLPTPKYTGSVPNPSH